MRAAAAALLAAPASAAVTGDLVGKIPGFNATGFKVYSGYLDVQGPFSLNEYDSLRIHYQFNTAQSGSASKPVVAWHQGGPGGSSTQGGMIEMSFFQVDSAGTRTNPSAWNNAANMLYLESPAGSGGDTGFSTCIKDNKPVKCTWNDLSQAEAYAHTVQAFFKAYSEFASNPFFLAGESYFGQYGPNIAHYILNNAPFSNTINLQGMLVGNGCWGEECNGPNQDQNDADMFYGKALVSKKLYQKVYADCGFPKSGKPDSKCEATLDKMHEQIGPYNVYDIYDNCPQPKAYMNKTGQTMRWLLKHARAQIAPRGSDALRSDGGYDWACGGTYPPGTVAPWFLNADVQKALHIEKPGQSDFDYQPFSPLSITLYPELVKKIRVLIYNGDADACVPYKGNEEWTTGLVDQGVITQSKAWHPWYSSEAPRVPAGYVTTYNVTGSDKDFSFLTIRLAGHMVPLFRPQPALSFFEDFITGKPF